MAPRWCKDGKKGGSSGPQDRPYSTVLGGSIWSSPMNDNMVSLAGKRRGKKRKKGGLLAMAPLEHQKMKEERKKGREEEGRREEEKKRKEEGRKGRVPKN